MSSRNARKVVIVGAGDVGASFAYALAPSGLAESIALVDLNTDLAKGQALDLAHGLPYLPPVDTKARPVTASVWRWCGSWAPCCAMSAACCRYRA